MPPAIETQQLTKRFGTTAAVQDLNPCLAEDPGQLGHLSRLVVVVAQHGDDRHADGRERPRELPALLGVAPVGEVATERQDVGALRDLCEDRLDRRAVGGSAEVDVADRGDPNYSWSLHHVRPINHATGRGSGDPGHNPVRPGCL